MLKKLCVYCGSSPGRRPEYIQGAQTLAKLFVENDIELVYGGAKMGIMGAIADTVLQNGGRATGIIPENLLTKEIAHDRLTELKVVASMHERKAAMAELSDGFIALPGGLGTLEEVFEILTWAQLGFHRKPVGLLNVHGYFDQLAKFLDHTVVEQFVTGDHHSMIMIEEEAQTLINRFSNYEPPFVEKWIDREST